MSVRKNIFAPQTVMCVIFLNTSVIFVSSFPSFSAWEWQLELIDQFFNLYFIVEILFKCRERGVKEFWHSAWNRFDAIILLLSLPSFVYFFLPHEFDFTFITLFRLFRIFKFFKFVSFFPNIKNTLAGMQRALHTSLFVILAFFIYMFVISLISCNLFHEKDAELFGNPFNSFYTIFKIFTIEGWNEIPERLIVHYPSVWHFWIKSYFMAIVLTGGMFGLSIVNAIFVDEMTTDNNRKLEKKVDELQEKIDLLIEQLQRQRQFEDLKD